MTKRKPILEKFKDGVVEYIEQPLEVLKGVREVFIAAKVTRGPNVEYIFKTKEIKVYA